MAAAAVDPVSAIAEGVAAIFNTVGGIVKASSQALHEAAYSANSAQDYNQNVQLGHQSILHAAIQEKTAQEQADAMINIAMVVGGVLIILFLMYFLFFRK